MNLPRQIPGQALPNEPSNDGQRAEWIAGRVETLLFHYHGPTVAPEVHEAAMGDWLDMLMPFPERAIDEACKGYMRDQPRRRPTPGDIRARALTHRKELIDAYRGLTPPEPEPKRDRVSPEVAARILKEAGFTPDLSNALKRFPQAVSKKQAQEKAMEPPQKEMTYETDTERLREARKNAGVIK